MNTHQPVSYTHLDVYKRQVLYLKFSCIVFVEDRLRERGSLPATFFHSTVSKWLSESFRTFLDGATALGLLSFLTFSCWWISALGPLSFVQTPQQNKNIEQLEVWIVFDLKICFWFCISIFYQWTLFVQNLSNDDS